MPACGCGDSIRAWSNSASIFQASCNRENLFTPRFGVCLEFNPTPAECDEAQGTQPWSRYRPYMVCEKIFRLPKRDVILLLRRMLLQKCWFWMAELMLISAEEWGDLSGPTRMLQQDSAGKVAPDIVSSHRDNSHFRLSTLFHSLSCPKMGEKGAGCWPKRGWKQFKTELICLFFLYLSPKKKKI